MSDEQQQVQDVDVKEDAAVKESAPALGLGDLAAMVQVIDVVCERGAFKGPELESVGILRGRIARFIDANKPAEPAEGATAPAAE